MRYYDAELDKRLDIVDEQYESSGMSDCGFVSVALACGIILRVDQTASSNQDVLRDE